MTRHPRILQGAVCLLLGFGCGLCLAAWNRAEMEEELGRLLRDYPDRPPPHSWQYPDAAWVIQVGLTLSIALYVVSSLVGWVVATFRRRGQDRRKVLALDEVFGSKEQGGSG